ncbi:hypothetical protein [Parabacteroides sp. PF5-9]|uniref:hypothetical protein n=1 Tax=Parabacteroides sp. PF5-9 TaxID=1742404 RepID=UPI002475D16E|nr:hypothetical protein [Parabacteroides sp. PF5-9]MDH6357173.1 hypothetical protein [Parabacteroides sp. PF5-9]
MKRALTSIFAIVLTLLVFYGGAGVNVVSFCCGECRAAGFEVLVGDKCCDIHGHSHDEYPMLESAEGNISHSHEMCCSMERLHFDWDNETVSTQSLEPFVIDLLALGTPGASIIPLPSVSEITSIMPTGPPLTPPRAYLSRLTVLLI